MIENVLEKIKQYKLALVIALIGVVIAGFMMLQREQKQENNIQQLMEQRPIQVRLKLKKANNEVRVFRAIKVKKW